MSYIVTLLKLHRALNILSDLAENAESESVRLGATRDLLDRAGFRPVDRHEIVKEKSVEELNAQLVSLVGENGAEMLISAFKSRRSISGPESLDSREYFQYSKHKINAALFTEKRLHVFSNAPYQI